MPLRVKTGPVSEPVTVDEVKAHLRLDSDLDDGMIAGLISAAREVGEKETARSFCLKTYVQSLDIFPYGDYAIRLDVYPVVDVQSVTYLDSDYERQTWDPSNYFVATGQAPALILPRRPASYPSTLWQPGGIEITFTAGHTPPGYGDEDIPELPEVLKLGVTLLAKHWYDNPDATQNAQQNKVPENFTDLFQKKKIYV